MKRTWAAMCVVLAVGGLVRAEGTSQDKIYSRQKAFRIPFQIPDPTEQKQLQEVQLYVARNGGKWEKYTSAPPEVAPDKRSFTFRTDQDGEFWFAVRTMDRKGNLNPAEDAEMQVGLRVIVDSEVPKVELRPVSRSGREVGLEWEVQDRNIDLESLKMEYRTDGQDSWRAVPGVVQKFFGQVFWASDAPGHVTVRCQVQDRAHNLGIQSIELEPSDSADYGQNPDSLGSGTNSNANAGLKPFNMQPDIPVNRPPLNTKSANMPTKRGSTNNRAVTVEQKFDSFGEPAATIGEESGRAIGSPLNSSRRSSPAKSEVDIDSATAKRSASSSMTK